MSIQSFIRRPLVAALLGATVTLAPPAALIASRAAHSDDAKSGTTVPTAVAAAAAPAVTMPDSPARLTRHLAVLMTCAMGVWPGHAAVYIAQNLAYKSPFSPSFVAAATQALRPNEQIAMPASLPLASNGGHHVMYWLRHTVTFPAARQMEDAAMAFDPRVKVVEGSSVSDGDEEVILVNSKGFCSSYRGAASSLSCAVIAEEHEKRQVNYWYSTRRQFADHEAPEAIGQKAAQRAVRLLSARKVPSGKFPVVFDPFVAASFLASLAGAVNGESVFRKLSFLADKVGQRIASEALTIIDDGRLPRGLGTKPFDGEGVITGTKAVIYRGVLKTYLYDSYTARKVKGASTGNAARSYGSRPHINPLNFYIPNGSSSVSEILASVDQGPYVTGMIGFGVDIVTGQFSRLTLTYPLEIRRFKMPIHRPDGYA